MHLTDLEPWVCTWCHLTHVFTFLQQCSVILYIHTMHLTDLEPWVCTWCHLTHLCSHFYNDVVLSSIHTMHLTDLEPWVCTWCHLTHVFTFLQQCSVILYTHNAPDWPWTLSMYVTWCHPTHGFSHFYNNVALSSIYTQCTWLTLNPEYVRDVIWPVCVHISTTM